VRRRPAQIRIIAGSPCPANTSSKLDSTMTELGEQLSKPGTLTLPVGHLAGLGKKAMRLAAEPAREPRPQPNSQICMHSAPLPQNG
jgi:hypothetical protein